MDQINDSGMLSCVVIGVHPKNTLMMFVPASGKYNAYDGAAGTSKYVTGTLTAPTTEAGDNDACIRMLNTPGTFVGLAAVAIALTDTLQGAADGKVSNTGTGRVVGTPLETAAIGEYFRFKPFV